MKRLQITVEANEVSDLIAPLEEIVKSIENGCLAGHGAEYDFTIIDLEQE